MTILPKKIADLFLARSRQIAAPRASVHLVKCETCRRWKEVEGEWRSGEFLICADCKGKTMTEATGCADACSHPRHRELVTAAAAHEPPPKPGQVEVAPVLVQLILERAKSGKAKYGTPLMTRNGRDATMDALQESLDLNNYLCQRVLELHDDLERVTAERDAARHNLEQARRDLGAEIRARRALEATTKPEERTA